MSFYVAGLWRYPVKSLAGERVSSTTLSADEKKALLEYLKTL